MPKGYQGKILWVDLSNRKIEELEPGEETYRNYLGGYGLGARFVTERMPAGTDPLGEKSVFGMASGLLTGTGALFSGRYMVFGKSPLTGGWGDANAGGYFSAELKGTGYDAVFFQGISESPVYLWINQGKAELREARELWGRDIVETEELIKKELGDPKIRVASIGPAGEKLSRISGIVNDKGRIAARSGLGAVMGSKRLKAVAVRGGQKVEIQNRKEIAELNRKLMDKYDAKADPVKAKKNLQMLPQFGMVMYRFLSFWNQHFPGIDRLIRKNEITLRGLMNRANDSIMPGFVPKTGFQFMSQLGTPGLTVPLSRFGDTPVKNWKGVIGEDFTLEEVDRLGDKKVLSYEREKFHCQSCPVGCGGIVDIRSGRFQGQEGHKPEYETIAAFGNMCLVSDVEAVINLSELCNRAGIDSISAGTTVAFALECFERGILTEKDFEGIKPSWGDARAVEKILEKIINREGIGELLADGVKVAAEKIGRGAEEFAVHAGGQELPMHHPLLVPSMGVAYLVEPTPGRHTISNLQYPRLMDLPRKYPEAMSQPLAPSFSPARKIRRTEGRVQATDSKFMQVANSAGLCLFGLTLGGLPVREWIQAATGWNISDREILTIGERILTLRRMFNCREGLRIEDIRLPKRVLGQTPFRKGPLANLSLDPDSRVKAYCEELGWDPVTGEPSAEKVKELGLGWAINS